MRLCISVQECLSVRPSVRPFVHCAHSEIAESNSNLVQSIMTAYRFTMGRSHFVQLVPLVTRHSFVGLFVCPSSVRFRFSFVRSSVTTVFHLSVDTSVRLSNSASVYRFSCVIGPYNCPFMKAGPAFYRTEKIADPDLY